MCRVFPRVRPPSDYRNPQPLHNLHVVFFVHDLTFRDEFVMRQPLPPKKHTEAGRSVREFSSFQVLPDWNRPYLSKHWLRLMASLPKASLNHAVRLFCTFAKHKTKFRATRCSSNSFMVVQGDEKLRSSTAAAAKRLEINKRNTSCFTLHLCRWMAQCVSFRYAKRSP